MTQIKDLAVKPDWDAQLAEFCKLMGINTEGLTCGWWLVSYWG
jgi:hypothetical protein